MVAFLFTTGGRIEARATLAAVDFEPQRQVALGEESESESRVQTQRVLPLPGG